MHCNSTTKGSSSHGNFHFSLCRPRRQRTVTYRREPTRLLIWNKLDVYGMYPKRRLFCQNINGAFTCRPDKSAKRQGITNVLLWIYGQRLRNCRKQAVYIRIGMGRRYNSRCLQMLRLWQVLLRSLPVLASG